MTRSDDRRSLQRSLGISAGLHFMLIPLFATSAVVFVGSGPASNGAPASETVSTFTIVRAGHAVHAVHPVAHFAPRVATRPVALAAVATRSTPEARMTRGRRPATGRPVRANDVARVMTGVPSAATVRRLALAIPTPGAERETAVERTAPTAVPAVATAAPALERTPAPPATSMPATPGPTPVTVAAARGIDVPAGGWGQSFGRPLVADDAALADLRSRYHSRAAITIDVDETGRATHVVLPASLAAEMRAELERKLMEMRYVPAECNGLRCDGTLELVL